MHRVSVIFAILYCSAFSLAEESRLPWTSSKVKGSPEPPKPYVAEIVWPHLTFENATDIAHLPSRKKIFVTQQRGKIFVLPDDIESDMPQLELFADLKQAIPEFASSFSIAFHPRFESNGEVYVFYRIFDRNMDDGTRISRFRVFDDRLELNPETEEILITFRSGGHNGGHLGFGPDGMLYILTGDSEVPSPPDPLDTGQDLTDLLSSVLRIDVDKRVPGKFYHVPEDNPFLDVPRARPEIWAYGFRNPWKLCFHPKTGDLWVGDVGWELWEMLYRVERGSNFGWPIIEGAAVIKPDTDPGPSPISAAAVMHPHTEFASITGGYVSQTDRLPGLKDVYLYGDYVTGQLWGAWFDEKTGKTIVDKQYLADTRLQIVSFGQAANGEVLFLDWPRDQHLYRLVPNPVKGSAQDFPRKLSEAGVFSDLQKQLPADGVYPFSINGEMWHDGATAERWIGIPEEETIQQPERGPFATIPEGTVLAKTLSHEGRKIETQLLHFENKAWQGYSYRWNKEQSDAELVDAAGKTEKIGDLSWTFHSRADCVRCHNIGSDYRLAFQPGQLNRDGQLERFQSLGLINDHFVKKAEKEPAAEVADEAAPIDLRARTWLSANCAHCHRLRGGGSVTIKTNLSEKLENMDLLGIKPLKGGFGLDDPKLLSAGQPFNSVLYYRSVTSGVGHMPMIGAKTVDPLGAKVLHDWIASLGDSPEPKPGGVSAALQSKHRIFTGELKGEEKAQAIQSAKESSDPIINGLFQEFSDD